MKGFVTMPVPPSQTAWKKANKIQVALDINRNQDPELYELFKNAEGSRGTIARELLREALEARKARQAE